MGRVRNLAVASDPPDLGSPRSHPVVRHPFNWKRQSMAAALCYGSCGGGASLAFHHQVDAYNTNSLIGALDQLRRALGGEKATLLWDGPPANRSNTMRAWLDRSGTGWQWSGTFIGDYFEVAANNGTGYVHFNANYVSIRLLGEGFPSLSKTTS